MIGCSMESAVKTAIIIMNYKNMKFIILGFIISIGNNVF